LLTTFNIMEFGNLLNSAGIDLPNISSGAGGFVKGILIFLLVGMIIAIATYFFSKNKSYNKHIHIFEEVNGIAIPSGTDKAREIQLPGTSMKVFLLKKRKYYLPRPSKQTGINHYWYFVRSDGEWINIGLKNLNEELTKLNISYDHTDMRIQNAALKKLVEKNYSKTSWLKEYAPYIAIGILILLLGVVFFLIIDKTGKVLGILGSGMEVNAELVETSKDLLESVNNICSGSGVIPVP